MEHVIVDEKHLYHALLLGLLISLDYQLLRVLISILALSLPAWRLAEGAYLLWITESEVLAAGDIGVILGYVMNGAALLLDPLHVLDYPARVQVFLVHSCSRR